MEIERQNERQNEKKMGKEREIKTSIYSRSLLTKRIVLPMSAIGKNLNETVERIVAMQHESKCIMEGFIKKGSTRIITYSSGLVEGDKVYFHVVFECMVAYPVEGQLIPCIVRNVTKAGIRAESAVENPSPIVVFVARDHMYESKTFNELKEGDEFIARVIGQRYELKDKYI
jgi:DNA-directed RNA polymerase subunit E'/Rpb7